MTFPPAIRHDVLVDKHLQFDFMSMIKKIGDVCRNQEHVQSAFLMSASTNRMLVKLSAAAHLGYSGQHSTCVYTMRNTLASDSLISRTPLRLQDNTRTFDVFRYRMESGANKQYPSGLW